ncbi:MAG: hypothetical protein ACLP00_08810 [Terracidiphilus sp.]
MNDVAARLAAKENTDNVKAQKILRDDGVRRNGTTELWRVLCDAYKAYCGDFNRTPGIRTALVFSPVGNQFTLGRPDSADVLRGVVYPDRCEVCITLLAPESKPYEETIRVRIAEDGSYYFAEKIAAGATDIDEVVRRSVDSLLGI